MPSTRSSHVAWGLAPASLAGFVCISATALGAPPRAAGPTESQLRDARELFVAAERDEDAGLWHEALAKFRRVADVKSTAGVRYHIALCEEHNGHLVTALMGFRAAEDQAVADKATDVLRAVGTETASLASRLPRLVVSVIPGTVAAPDVTLDGEPVPRNQLGSAFAVDPGEHRVQATAPGRLSSSAVVMMREHDVSFIELPLQPLAPPTRNVATAHGESSPTAATRDRISPERPTRARALAVAASTSTLVFGAAGVGAFFAAEAAHSNATHQCAITVSGAADACDSQKQWVRTWDWIAAGTWAAAAVTAVASVALWSQPGTSQMALPALRIFVGPSLVGMKGTF